MTDDTRGRLIPPHEVQERRKARKEAADKRRAELLAHEQRRAEELAMLRERARLIRAGQTPPPLPQAPRPDTPKEQPAIPLKLKPLTRPDEP